MNKTYRNVWNATTNTWTAAAETAKGHTKGSKRAMAVAVAALLALPAGAVFAATDAEDEDDTKQEHVIASSSPNRVANVSGTGSIGTMGAIGVNGALDGGNTNGSANSVAYGPGAVTNGSFNTAVGTGAAAQDSSGGAVNNSTAVGNQARALGTGANALGNQATANGGATAVGHVSSATGTNSVALGYSANATANGAVALGYGSVADVANTVSVGTAANQRRIVNVATGTANTDAVNLGQMNTALSTKVDDTYVKIDPTSNATAAQADRSAMAIGANAQGTAVFATALGNNTSVTGRNGTAVGFGAQTAGEAGVAMGSGASASGFHAVALGTSAAAAHSESVALGTSSATDRANSVSVGNASMQRQITNMAAGTAATDAVNVSQLTPVVNALGGGATINPDGSVTGPTYNLANGGAQTTVGGALGALDGALTTTNGRVGNLESQLGSGTIGLVQQDTTSRTLTVGKDTDGREVDFTGTAGTRKLTGVSAGTVAAGSTDAINGGQLHTASKSVADAIGGGSTVGSDGSITQPSFTVGDGMGGTKIVRNVGDAVDNLNTRVTGNETAIGDIRNELGNGTVGLVQQDATSRTLTVGKGTNGTDVDFRNNANATRTLTGVTAGAVSATSTDAINGTQLYTASKSVADAIGGGSTVGSDGSITQPSFTVGNGAGGTVVVRNVGDVVSNLDGRVTNNESAIGDIRSELGSGALGLVRQASPSDTVTVAAASGGTTVNFTGTDGVRVLSGIGAGIGNNDAVSVGQLKSVIGYNIIDPLDPLMAVRYDGANMGAVTFGGDPMFGTYLNNVRGGLIAAGSMQAVNGGQLWDAWQKIGELDGRVGTIESGIADGSIGGPGTGTPEGSVPSPGKGDGSTAVGAGSSADGKDSSAIGNGAVASKEGSTAVGAGSSATGDKSSAIGQGSAASGDNSTAIGQGSSATKDGSTAIGQGASSNHAGSVALGQGSTTTRDGEVSIGSEGNERFLGNVRDGVRDTDAVNVRQLNNTVRSARQDAMGGVAAAMAVAGLPTSTMPGKTFMAISGSTYGGEQGTAIGASYMSKNGKWIVKGAVNTSTRGEVGAVVGGGFYW